MPERTSDAVTDDDVDRALTTDDDDDDNGEVEDRNLKQQDREEAETLLGNRLDFGASSLPLEGLVIDGRIRAVIVPSRRENDQGVGGIYSN